MISGKQAASCDVIRSWGRRLWKAAPSTPNQKHACQNSINRQQQWTKHDIISPNRSLSSTDDASKWSRRLTWWFLWFTVIFFFYWWSRWRDHLLPLFLCLGVSLFLRVILILREIGQALVHLAVLHLQQVCTIKAKLTSALICRFSPVISSNLWQILNGANKI